MKIECHILQNFPPHCLNRDDTNTPKDCEFGGVRRARISSQCLKRAVRDVFERYQDFSADQKAVRTKRIVEKAAEILEQRGKSTTDAVRAINALLSGVDLKTESKNEGLPKTQYLLYLPLRKLEELASIVDANWDALTAVPTTEPTADEAAPAEKKKTPKKTKKVESAAELPKEAKAAALRLFSDARATPEIALFGRMIADNADWNMDASCQVAHALSTHRVSMEFDFFTAIDDCKDDAESGSDMMGTNQFNSSCFYRYAVLDCNALRDNLGGADQKDLVTDTVRAFLKAFIVARPTGKQNSMAAHTLPALVLFTVRDGGEPISLANAFVEPVKVSSKTPHLVGASTDKLLTHFRQVSKMYPGGLVATHACWLEENAFEVPAGFTVHENVDAAVSAVTQLGVGGATA